ncbi:MAG: Gmad2 immunoglobulin-like domain-containing protein [Candidatus Pacebacteria bacterium]|nr:Gmad2 immunoglobulin-like domain-containing protein [Candidatus Paceibacterota bacterium]
MQIFGLLSLLITIAVAAWWLTTAGPVAPPSAGAPTEEIALDPVITAGIEAHSDLIVLTSPEPYETISNPLKLTGKARGNWYFEGSFPVILTDWDGRIIAEAPAMARGPWMTENFVPFTLTLNFETPYHVGDPDFMKRGSLILKKDNPSGLPENDDALEIPIMFSAVGEVVPVQNSRSSYGDVLDRADEAARSLEF